MTADAEKFRQLTTLLRTIDESKRVLIGETIDGFNDVNYVSDDSNLLRLICSQRTVTTINIPGVGYRQQQDPFKEQLLIQCINKVLDRGIDRGVKFGSYKAPILFFAEDPVLFTHLCEEGFDPNERLIQSGYEGYPFFMLHHHFEMNNYKVAKRFGFDPHFPLSRDKNLLQLFFSRFVDFNLDSLEELLIDFDSMKNIPDPVTGMAPIHTYIASVGANNFSYKTVGFLLQHGFDPNVKTEEAFFGSSFEVPAGSTSIDILNIYYSVFGSDEWKDKMQRLLR